MDCEYFTYMYMYTQHMYMHMWYVCMLACYTCIMYASLPSASSRGLTLTPVVMTTWKRESSLRRGSKMFSKPFTRYIHVLTHTRWFSHLSYVCIHTCTSDNILCVYRNVRIGLMLLRCTCLLDYNIIVHASWKSMYNSLMLTSSVLLC